VAQAFRSKARVRSALEATRQAHKAQIQPPLELTVTRPFPGLCATSFGTLSWRRRRFGGGDENPTPDVIAAYAGGPRFPVQPELCEGCQGRRNRAKKFRNSSAHRENYPERIPRAEAGAQAGLLPSFRFGSDSPIVSSG